jgi:putative membrane protein
MKRIALLPVAFTAVLSLACNTDNRNTSDESAVGTTGDAVSAGDRAFVDDLTIVNMAEVELGRMAMERGSSAEVKRFGDMMAKDHSKAGDELKQIAMQHAIPMPAGLDQQHQDLKMTLSNLRGAEFDREYMNAMVEGHEDVVDRLQARASEDRVGDDKGTVTPERSDNPVEASINQWAAAALPTTRHHLDEARRIRDGLARTLTQR